MIVIYNNWSFTNQTEKIPDMNNEQVYNKIFI